MRIEGLAVALRPRSLYEATDLGVRLARPLFVAALDQLFVGVLPDRLQ